MIVEAGGHVAAIPLSAVRRIERVAASSIVRTAEGLAMPLDDLTIAFDSLARLLGGRASTQAAHTAVIVGVGATLAAIAVDQLRGVEEIVVRALPDAPIDPIVLGVMLDDDGRPRPVLDPATIVAQASRPSLSPEEHAPSIAPILIVDDSLTTRMLEQSILESAGYVVETASSAEEALDKAAARSYALFLVDVEMPGMDGFQLVTEIRRRPAIAAVPTIMVTSRASPEDRQRGAAAGANGFMAKGEFDQVALLAMIRELVTS
jgi:two-component system chemotaxis sensor kinase CheA